MSRTNSQPTPRTPEASPMLRWTLSHEGAAITCGIDMTEHRSFEVCVIPHWDVSASVFEEFDAASSALTRHAEIATRLREAGWTATSRA